MVRVPHRRRTHMAPTWVSESESVSDSNISNTPRRQAHHQLARERTRRPSQQARQSIDTTEPYERAQRMLSRLAPEFQRQLRRGTDSWTAASSGSCEESEDEEASTGSSGSSAAGDEERSVDEPLDVVIHLPRGADSCTTASSGSGSESEDEERSTGSSAAGHDERSIDERPDVVIHLPSERRRYQTAHGGTQTTPVTRRQRLSPGMATYAVPMTPGITISVPPMCNDDDLHELEDGSAGAPPDSGCPGCESGFWREQHLESSIDELDRRLTELEAAFAALAGVTNRLVAIVKEDRLG